MAEFIKLTFVIYLSLVINCPKSRLIAILRPEFNYLFHRSRSYPLFDYLSASSEFTSTLGRVFHRDGSNLRGAMLWEAVSN